MTFKTIKFGLPKFFPHGKINYVIPIQWFGSYTDKIKLKMIITIDGSNKHFPTRLRYIDIVECTKNWF